MSGPVLDRSSTPPVPPDLSEFPKTRTPAIGTDSQPGYGCSGPLAKNVYFAGKKESTGEELQALIREVGKTDSAQREASVELARRVNRHPRVSQLPHKLARGTFRDQEQIACDSTE